MARGRERRKEKQVEEFLPKASLAPTGRARTVKERETLQVTAQTPKAPGACLKGPDRSNAEPHDRHPWTVNQA